MKTLSCLIALSLLFVLLPLARGEEFIYSGPWICTKGKRIDGVMKAHVTPIKANEWKARFWGVWQGVAFDYTVPFNGADDSLIGKATIDGARYEWKGTIDRKQFKATFTGDRYDGSFDMSRVDK